MWIGDGPTRLKHVAYLYATNTSLYFKLVYWLIEVRIRFESAKDRRLSWRRWYLVFLSISTTNSLTRRIGVIYKPIVGANQEISRLFLEA